MKSLGIFCLSIMISLNSWAGLFGGDSQSIPTAAEAIQFELEETATSLIIHWSLGDTVYLYHDKVKLLFADKTPYRFHQFSESPVTIEDPAFGAVPVFYNSATTKTLKWQTYSLW